MPPSDLRSPQPRGRPSLTTLLILVSLGLALGIAVQEFRWRGVLGKTAETPAQQLKLAESDFRSGNDPAAAALFQHLAASNDPAAQFWLGHMTELGLGLPADAAKAIALYEKAAAQGSVPAAARLGEIYLQGNVVPPDFAKARQFLDQAARKGSAQAAMELGQLYRLGLSVPPDPVEAYAWSELAALEGLTFARTERDAALKAMPAAERDEGAARAAALFATIHGRPPAPVPAK